MLEIKDVKMIESFDLDNLVVATYGRPYCFQQQDDCQPRGIHRVSVPPKYVHDYPNDTLPEIVNHHKMGVSFKAWLQRNPTQPLKTELNERDDGFSIELWWHRNFYPSLSMILQDLHGRGLIPEGKYIINIDW